MNKDYRFPGMVDFLATEGVKPSFAVKIPGLFFVARVSDALGQIPTSPAEHRAGMYAVADEAILALEAALRTAKAAYAAVLKECPPSAPEPPPKPAAAVRPPVPPPVHVPGLAPVPVPEPVVKKAP